MSVEINKRIAKNTMFLYFGMILVMAVTLYTSRVTLKILGVDDFGIYQIVGGTVTFLAFLSNALGSGSSRFITFEMGKEKPRLSALFATVRIAHIVLGVVIVVLGEIIGLWFIYNKLVIPKERLSAAAAAFHFSMLATFFQITQVPYNATIIAHEKMNIYAYISVLEAVLKLAIVYVLLFFYHDKLELYAALMCATTVAIMIFYRLYCRKSFDEVRNSFIFDKDMFKGIASFSGWNLLTSSAASLANQGVTVVTNMFYNPAVVTTRSLAFRINDIINQFIGNYRTAINPQIIKKYAAKDYEGSNKLALVSVKYTYFLMLIIVVPLMALTEPLLGLWLEDVPDGLIEFVRLALIQGLFQAIDTSLYVPIYAKGRIKENAIISPLFDSLQLPVVYILFKKGFPPVTLAWVGLIAYMLLAVVIKPILVHVIAEYNYKNIMLVIGKCCVVTILSGIIPFVLFILFDVNSIKGFSVVFIASILYTGIIIWIFGIEREMKQIITTWTKNIITKR